MTNELYLCNFVENVKKEDFNDNLSKLWSGQWFDFIKSDITNQMFQHELKVPEDSSDDDILSHFIAYFCLFVQENFTGPDLESEYSDILQSKWPENVSAKDALIVDSENLNGPLKYPELLLIAKVLIEYLCNQSPSLINKWWKLRYLCVHQKVLEELTHSLYKEFQKTATNLLEENIDLLSDDYKSQLLVEISQGFLLFRRVEKANKFLEKAYKCLNIEAEVEGFLGYRTQHQQKPLPQLLLSVSFEENRYLISSKKTHGQTNLPRLLKLDDDVRLEKIRFVDPCHNEAINIPSLAQLLILAKSKLFIKSQPKGVLCDEELMPYVSTLLHQDNGPLFVRISALFLNIKQECNHQRTIDRSLKQCEELLKILKEHKYTVPERFSYVFASFLKPRWEIKRQCGDIMMSLGLVKTALDLYLNICSWDNVIECYTKLELRHKAAEIIQQQIDKEPSATLYCLLGDATDDEQCYEKAWEFSKFTSGRAQRHWGNYYFAKADYAKAIPHYEKSLQINSLQENIWLRLGYCALMEEKWEVAVGSYLRYTHLDPGCFESWNNLAKALIKLGEKDKAHKMLKEAIKCNYCNWKIWENFMLVSIDTGNFEDVINAYNRLIELKERYLDVEILKILTNAIISKTPDAQGKSSERLTKKGLTLLGHVCVQYPNEFPVWELSAQLSQSSLTKAQKLQKAYRAYTSHYPTWHDTAEYTIKLLNLCKDLCELSLKAVDDCETSEKTSSISQLSSARLTLQGCIRVTESKADKTFEINEIVECAKDLLEQVTAKLATLR